ncbi:MAG: hypothetical protein LBC27_06210 [Spirochaetaceae bacterium]|nr:hypothetical protein [Spirochaetaceae bacterium]
MPAADVTISATFSQIPVKSNFLAELGVSVPAVITPQLSGELNYTALIPHIAAVAPEVGDDTGNENGGGMTFALIVVQEDPEANVDIKDVTDGSEAAIENLNEISLEEGKKKYKITVSREELDDRIYNFTVSYEPDLSLKSITLANSDANWLQPLPIQDTQTVTIPHYAAINITAQPSDEGANTEISLKSGPGTFAEPTLTITGNDSAELSLEITVKKKTNDKDKSEYKKSYLLNIRRVSSEDYVPTEFRASGGGITILKEGEDYYEIHTFTSNSTLVFNSQTDVSDLNAWVLVVAGGGGGGGGDFPASGGGAGGMIETLNTSGNYTYSLSSGTLAYDVTVGLGGDGGKSGHIGSSYQDNKLSAFSNGSKGGDSKFGVAGSSSPSFVAIGGGGGAKRYLIYNIYPGSAGGSSGGGSSSPAVEPQTYPTGQAVAYGNIGGVITTDDSSFAAGGGGAGGAGAEGSTENINLENSIARGGPGKESSITGAAVTYSRGGGTPVRDNSWKTAGRTGEPNTGNGGGGAWNNIGGAGGSGIVIVRFLAKPPAAD